MIASPARPVKSHSAGPSPEPPTEPHAPPRTRQLVAGWAHTPPRLPLQASRSQPRGQLCTTMSHHPHILRATHLLAFLLLFLLGFNERRGYQGAWSGTLAFLTFPGLYQRLHRMLFFVVLSIDTVWDGKPWFVFCLWDWDKSADAFAVLVLYHTGLGVF
ncbi:hypothetical protein B0I37DRAFT_152473 [Chaetomium sp. MPI-CAGE-AT-0009]|nr:hypothetical protein B0I37DRAFT_152473 [Chaetomium sp. MPI-CAGE-AT-0009]